MVNMMIGSYTFRYTRSILSTDTHVLLPLIIILCLLISAFSFPFSSPQVRIAESDAACDALKQANDATKDSLHTRDEECRTLRDELGVATREGGELEREGRRLRGEIERAQSTIRDREAQEERLQAKVKAMADGAEERSVETEEALKRLRSLNREAQDSIRKLERERDTLQREKEDVVGRHEGLGRDLATLQVR